MRVTGNAYIDLRGIYFEFKLKEEKFSKLQVLLVT